MPSRWKRSWIISATVLVAVIGIISVNLSLAIYARLGHGIAEALGSAVRSLDYGTISLLNKFARRSWALDEWFLLADSNWLATAPLLMAFWWYWFKEGEEREKNREFALFGILASFAAVVLARILADSLPFRERPLANPSLHFHLPYGMRADRLLDWSSFPSDHGAVWFALVASIFFISRRAGIFLFLYVTLTLAVARMYLGAHYPTDIIVGGLIGIGTASLVKFTPIRERVTRKPLEWMSRAPHLFYICFFLLTAQLTQDFSSAHELYDYLEVVVAQITKLV